MPKPSSTDWQAETLRLSVFTLTPNDAISQHWQSLMPLPPETVNRPPQKQQIIEEGPWGSSRLQVLSQPGQIHWRTFSVVSKQSGPIGVGSFDGAIRPFRELMEKWLSGSCPSINRLAFGAILLLPASSLKNALRQLDRMLDSVTVNSNGTQDFMYRNNLRSKSAHHGLQINRLATWSAMETVGIEIAIGTSQPPRAMPTEHYCRLELDINTVPLKEISRANMPLIFRELVEAATEIAEQGDIS